MNIKRFAIPLWFFFKHIHEFIELYFWSLSIIYCKVSLVKWKILYLFINNPKRVVSTKGGSWFMYCVVTRIIIFFQGYLYGAIAYYKEKNDSFQIFFLWSVNANARIETQNSIHFYNHNTVTGCLYYLEVVWWIFARMRYNEINVMCTIQH